jgi:hypothetical protein
MRAAGAAAAAPADPLNRALLFLEHPGRPWAALSVAVALVLLSLRRVSLGGHPTFLGKYYAMLASDPFHPAVDNPVGHRILAPFLSWALGLRGPYLLYTDLLAVLALLAAAYLWMRRLGHAPGWAIVAASTLAFTMVTLTTLHYGGYPDAMTYLFVLLAWISRGRWWAGGLWYFAALLCHESAVLLAPWLLLAIATAGGEGERGRWTRATLTVVVVLALFSAFRVIDERAHPSVAYTMKFYLAPLRHDPLHWFRESAPDRLLGIGAAFNLFWAVPLLAGARMLVRRAYTDAAVLLLPIPCALAQLFIAYDTTRMATLAFMSVLLGTEYLVRTNGFAARWWLVPLAAASFFLPQVNVAMGVVDFMGPH